MNHIDNPLNGIGDRFRTQVSVTAVLSLAAGIAGMFLCLFGSIPAVVLGHSALRQIRGSGGRLSGSPVAYAGLLLGYGQLALFALFFGLMLIGLAAGPEGPVKEPETSLASPSEAAAATERGRPAHAAPLADGPELKTADDVTRILSAIAAFRRDCGAFPGDENGLRDLFLAPDGVQGWRGPYLPMEPMDFWGRPYVYRKSDIGVEVFSTGEDGAESADDLR